MARKDILLPFGERTGNPVDIDDLLKNKMAEKKRKEIERDEEIAEAKHEATLAKLKKDVKTSEVAVEKTESKATESGFKVKGEVNIGNIDFDAERKQATQDLKELKEKQESNIRALGVENEQLRDKIHGKEMDILKISFQSQMEMLTKMIEANASRGSFGEQLNAARTIAQELGYAQPSVGASGDLMTQLKLKELEFNQTRELRKLSREEKQAERQWQLELRRLDDERDERKAKAEREAKKDEMFAKAPEIIGRTIASAVLESKGGGGDATPISSKGMRPGIIEIGIGESGETDCLNCRKPVAIGPTAKVAVCAGCGSQYPIKRTETGLAESATEQSAPLYEEQEM